MTANAATGADRPQPDGRAAYTLAEFAALFGKSRRWARNRYNAKQIPGRPLGRDVMVPAEFVHEYRTAPREASP